MKLVRNSKDKWKSREKMDRQFSKDASHILENKKEKDSTNFSDRLTAHVLAKLYQLRKANLI